MIHELGDAFDDRNMFLQVTLGMISMSLRFDALLEEYGTPVTGLPRPDSVPDPALAFVLGLLSFSQRVRRYADEARTNGQPVAADTSPLVSPAGFHGLLR